MAVTVTTEGFKDLERALQDLTNAASKGVARRAMLSASEELVRKVQAITPVDEGDLKKSITASTALASKQARLHRRLKSGAEVFVGPSYNLGDGGRHGHLVEFGTQHSTAKPFLRPAWASDQKLMLKRISKEMALEIEKSIARAQRKAARLAAKT